MMSVLRRLTLAVAAVAALGVGQMARADSMTLAQLIAGGELICGDKVFTNFRNFIPTGTGSPAASDITVTCELAADGAVELFFTSGGWFVSAGQTIDTFFIFDVVVTGPQAITRVEAGLLASSTAGTGSISLDETIFPYQPDTIFPQDEIASIGLHKPGGPTFAGVDINPARQVLTITKDLALRGGTDGTASISAFGQRFVQTVVPEPSSVILMGMGVTLMVGYGWRRRKSS